MKIKSRFNFILASIVIGVFITLVFSVSVTATIKVEPSRYIVHTEPGARVTESINVTNNSDQTAHLVANFYDWDADQDYKLKTHEPGTLDSSLDGYFRFNPRKFTLPAGETQTVRFTINIPEDGENKERRGVIFVKRSEDISDDETGAKVVRQIGTTVYAIPKDLGYTMNILESRVVRNETGQILGAFLTENKGERHFRFDLKYTVISEEGKEVEQDKVEEKVLLPNTKRGVVFPLKNRFESGEYQLNVEFTFPDTDKKLTENVKFSVGDD
ncbi:MAG: hypothetical protein ACOC1M_03785 [Halanaerobium sp.]